MKTFPALIVCEHCDSVHRRQAIGAGEVARCQACAAVLYRSTTYDADSWLALTVAAAIAFVIANVCPVILISVNGLHSETTLWRSAAALAQGATAPIAVPSALAMFGVPLAQICLLAWVLLPARTGRRAPGFNRAMRLLVLLRPWSMVEVCLLGILVAAIKLSSFLQVVPGSGLWALAALMVLIPLIASRDMSWLWEVTSPAEILQEPECEPTATRS